MGQFLSHSPDPPREQQGHDLEAFYPSVRSEQSGDTEDLKDSPGPRARYQSISADQYHDLGEHERNLLHESNKRKLNEEYAELYHEHKEKIDEYGDAIQPHTDQGGEQSSLWHCMETQN